MTTQTRDPVSFDASSGTWDATTFGTINDYPDTSTYLTHGTTAGNATWNINAPTVPTGAVNISVSVLYYRRKTSSQTCNMAGRLKIGSSYYNGSTSNPSTSMALDTETWANNPATGSAWTPATVNNIAAIGVYSTDASPTIQVASVRLKITYDLVLTAEHGVFTLSGQAATLTKSGGGGTPAVIELVQAKGNHFEASTGANQSFDALPTVGHLITVEVSGWLTSFGPSSVQDNQGNEYTRRREIEFDSGAEAAIYDCIVETASGTFTITVTPGSSSDFAFTIAEYSGVDPDDPYDQSNSASGADETALSGSLTPSVNGCMWTAVLAHTGTDRSITEQVGTLVYEHQGGSSSMPISATYGVQTTAAAIQESWALAEGCGYGGVIAVYKPAMTGGGGYTLAASQGSFALTGQAVDLRVSRVMAAGQGSISLSGQSVNLLRGRVLNAALGSYTLSGQTVGLVRGLRLVAAQGSIQLTGQAVNLRISRMMGAASGSFSLSGMAAGLRVARRLSMGTGSFSLVGQAVNLVYTPIGGYTLTAAAGLFTLTGQAAGLRVGRRISLETGNPVLSGQAANLVRAVRLRTETGTYTLSGQAMAFGYGGLTHYTLAVAVGLFSLTGPAVGLIEGWLLQASDGLYPLTGEDAALRITRRLVVETGYLILPGKSVNLAQNRILEADWGFATLTGFPVEMMHTIVGERLDRVTGKMVHRQHGSQVVHRTSQTEVEELGFWVEVVPIIYDAEGEDGL